jgi:hypothetical protein
MEEGNRMMVRFITCTALAGLLLAAPVQAFEKASNTRQEQVERRGAQVMPFNLERTLHIFTKTKSGGIQQVVAKDQADSRQITLIREHLSKISEEFAQGNFSDPAKIHGKDIEVV